MSLVMEATAQLVHSSKKTRLVSQTKLDERKVCEYCRHVDWPKSEPLLVHRQIVLKYVPSCYVIFEL